VGGTPPGSTAVAGMVAPIELEFESLEEAWCAFGTRYRTGDGEELDYRAAGAYTRSQFSST